MYAMDWRWAAACIQRAGRGYIVSPRAQVVLISLMILLLNLPSYFLNLCETHSKITYKKSLHTHFCFLGTLLYYLLSLIAAFPYAHQIWYTHDGLRRPYIRLIVAMNLCQKVRNQENSLKNGLAWVTS